MKKNISQIYAFKNFISLFTTFLLVIGCTKAEPDSAIFFDKGQKVSLVKEETIFANLGPISTNLDWRASSAHTSIIIFKNIMHGLTQIDSSSEKPRLVNSLAQKISHDSSGRVWTIKVRRDVTWSDGVGLVASDFVRAWKSLLKIEKRTVATAFLDHIKNGREFSRGVVSFSNVGISLVDDYTIKVKLDKSLRIFPMLLSEPVSFPVRDIHLNTNFSNLEQFPVVGAYVPKAAKQDNALLLERNDVYFNGRPPVKNILIRTVESGYTASKLISKGELDFNSQIPERISVPLQKFGSTSSSLRSVYLGFNTQNLPFSSAKVRRSVGEAIDRGQIMKIISNKGKEQKNWVPDVLYSKSTLAKISKIPSIESKKTIFPARRFVLLIPADERSGIVGANLQHQLSKKLGIKIDIDQVPWKFYQEKIKEGDFDIYFAGWSADYPDPLNFFQLLLPDSLYNQSRWENKKYSNLYLRASLVDSDLQEIFPQLEQIIFQEVPVIPLFTNFNTVQTSLRLKGMSPDSMKIYRFSKGRLVKYSK